MADIESLKDDINELSDEDLEECVDFVNTLWDARSEERTKK